MTQITGTAANDKLNGTAANDSFDGLGGNDTLIGGKGDDVYYAENYDGNRDRIVEAAGGGFDWAVITGVDTHSFILPANVEGLANYGDFAGFTGIGNTLANQMLGSGSTDFLSGMTGNDQIDGGGGIDTLDGGAGNDELYDTDGRDTLIGGTGNDTYVITATTTVTEAANAGTDLIWADFNIDLNNYANVENLHLAGKAGLAASGNALNNFITGNDGGNDLVGNGGNDTIDGGAGADGMAGGVGNDTYYVDDAGDSVFEGLGQGKDQVFASTSYQLTTGQEIEALTLTGVADIDAWGNDLGNVITGNAGKNHLAGGFGTDTLIGGKGDDHYFLSVFDAADKIVEKAGEGYDEVDSSVSVTLGANLEMLWLAHAGGNLDGTGNTLANTLIGNDGNNRLDGLAGDDVLDGLEGADTLLGGTGNDVMDGGAGVDFMSGGTGNDQYYVDNPFDTIVETASGGTLDGVVFAYAVAKVDLTQGPLANLEVVSLLEDVNAQVFGNARANIINALGGNDYLDGGAGDDLLRGRDGNDLLAGDAGNDILNGGNGADAMAGGAGNDTYIVDDQLDLVDETLGGGTDTVQSDVSFSLQVGDGQVFGGSVENLLLTGDAHRIGKGNDLNNIIESGGGQDQLQGLGGNDILAGGAGDDQLKGGIGNDLLEGGAGDDQLVGDAGSDKMLGGAGDDAYLVDSTGDKVTELAGQGQDTVIALVANYTLGANVENLGFFGAVGNAVGNGNTLDNIIVGADGDDKLNGAAGSDQLAGDNGNDKLVGGTGEDVLEGGLGFDTLDGGAGSDVFLYALDNPGNLAGLGGDVISSFEHGKDTIDVRDLFDDFGINTANPFASGHLIIDNTGVNAVLSFDRDGGGGAAPVTLAVVGHVDLQAADVTF